ncbi:hypothetical protein POF50_016545 [Streptomyces sp. SL13]|uniref:Prolyl-tRNA synthetase n=1 Tax=Streptantibioticus silvisoli TaxID=2705255 RepID=A0AA90K9I6_9ACTN|nr:hypothetical protein [Streptantibioticus silvisoli]MDI5970932.1 hypothetical protein [Streptantibioticus silvisoli]
MATQPYVRALEAAEFIMGPPAVKGTPMWRGRGVDAVRLLVDDYLALVRERFPAEVVEHGFLASQADNRRVFGEYGNVYELTDVPGDPDAQFRSDNIVASIARLERDRSAGPLVAIGAIMRHFPGSTPPLFRDRLVWPVVELNQLVEAEQADGVLDFHRSVVERMLWDIGIPSITVCTDELAGYGKVTYLVVTALPNRRPTVLATLYVLADGLRSALGPRREIIDIGFTGKVLATAAMLHMDARGLALPSTIAPVQLGVTAAPQSDPATCERWLTGLRAAGLRCEVRQAGDSSRSRARAEEYWHRTGTPLVIGLDRSPDAVTLCTRFPLHRVPLGELPAPERVRDLLDRHDTTLRSRSRRLLENTVERNGHLRTLCPPCAARPGVAVFGHVVPAKPGDCQECGDEAGQPLFLSEEGRFY